VRRVPRTWHCPRDSRVGTEADFRWLLREQLGARFHPVSCSAVAAQSQPFPETVRAYMVSCRGRALARGFGWEDIDVFSRRPTPNHERLNERRILSFSCTEFFAGVDDNS